MQYSMRGDMIWKVFGLRRINKSNAQPRGRRNCLGKVTETRVWKK